ncbi:MAG: putative manganese-dependent inorganic diphosphatase [Bacilli bacterium]
MEKTYIFGHRKPDTDSICAAITLSYLKNCLGQHTIPVALSSLNDETKFVLKFFGIQDPPYLNDVKLQLRDINYHKNFMIDYHASIYDAFKKMNDNNISAIPITNKQKLIGIVSLKDMTRDFIEGSYENIDTSYNNIVRVLNGREILKFDDEIKGNLIVASYKSTTIIESVLMCNNDILIVGDRHSVIEYAINSKVKLIILVGKANLKEEHYQMAAKNKINVIKVESTSLKTVKRINLCNYISTLISNNHPVSFLETDYINDFLEKASKIRHTNYPIVNAKNNCLGLLKIADVNDNNPKKVILVDHNESMQSAEGIDEADILEIIDHHKIGTLNTKKPINFRNMAVGSTCTIIYQLYEENNIKIPKNIAGLLLAGILSDTLMFKSPTTTPIDNKSAMKLAKIADLDYEDFAMKMFKAASNFKNIVDKEDVLYRDFKNFTIDNNKVGIGQIFTLNIEDIMDEKEEYIKLLEREAENNNYDIILFIVTDIVKNGSYIFYNQKAVNTLENSFRIEKLHQGYYLQDCLSRKKQIIPNIMDALDKNI